MGSASAAKRLREAKASMDDFNIWGQIQELSPSRLLVIATACPVRSGRQASFSEVVSRPDEARYLLGRLVEKLQQHIAAKGGRVLRVHRLPDQEGQQAIASARHVPSQQPRP